VPADPITSPGTPAPQPETLQMQPSIGQHAESIQCRPVAASGGLAYVPMIDGTLEDLIGAQKAGQAAGGAGRQSLTPRARLLPGWQSGFSRRQCQRLINKANKAKGPKSPVDPSSVEGPAVMSGTGNVEPEGVGDSPGPPQVPPLVIPEPEMVPSEVKSETQEDADRSARSAASSDSSCPPVSVLG